MYWKKFNRCKEKVFLPDLVFENHAKFTFACNELPMVYDLSRGFWDRWILLDFPYEFTDQSEINKMEDDSMFKLRDEDIISKITTEEELSGLLNKFLEGLERLMKNRKFSSTLGSDEVKDRWIRKANSFIAFCFDMIEEDYESKISKKELRKRYAQYCKEHKISSKSDIVIKRTLQESYGANETFGNSGLQDGFDRYWEGIKWKK